MAEKVATKSGFAVVQTENVNGHQEESVRLELDLHIDEKHAQGGVSLKYLTALANDAIIDHALSDYPHLITEDPMNFYQTKGSNDYLGELAQSPEWRQKASKELIKLCDQFNKEQN